MSVSLQVVNGKENFDPRIKGFETLLEKGNAMFLTSGRTWCLYHKCPKDQASPTVVPGNKISIYEIENEPNNLYFNSELYDKLQKYFNEKGYKCECSLNSYLRGIEGLIT